MAGIGFRLKKMLSEETFTGLLKGYLFSTVISSGPWLISVVCLSLLGILSATSIGGIDREVFGVTIVYIYVGTLLLTGFMQPVITRIMADELYSRNRENIASMFVSVMVVTILMLTGVGALFIAFAKLTILYKVMSVILFVLVGCIWQLMIFLSASSDYKTIVGGFLAGSVIGVAGGFLGGRLWELPGYISGFTLGQAFIFFILCYKVIEDYHVTISFNWSFIKGIKKFPEMALIGILSYLGTWVDKFIFWWAEGTRIEYIFYSYPQYDAAMFLAFLTSVPAMAHFLIVIETNFYLRYREFFLSITAKKALRIIRRNKLKIIKELLSSFLDLMKIQILITFLVIFFAPYLLGSLNFQPAFINIFRTAVWGVTCYSMVMMIAIILLYFDLRKPALFIYTFLSVTNAVFTYITTFPGEAWHGYGYAVASLLTFIVAVGILAYYLNNLEYITFINQSIAGELKDAGKLNRKGQGIYHIKGKVKKSV